MAGSASISYGYVHSWNRNKGGGPIFSDALSETLTTNETTSTGTTGVHPGESGGRELAARVVLSEEGYIKIGASPTADKTASMRLPANAPEYFAILPGEKVAVIDTA